MAVAGDLYVIWGVANPEVHVNHVGQSECLLIDRRSGCRRNTGSGGKEVEKCGSSLHDQQETSDKNSNK